MKILGAILLALIGSLFAYMAYNLQDSNLRFVLGWLALLLYFFSILLTAAWLIEEVFPLIADFLYELKRVRVVTPELEIVRAIASLSPVQAEVFFQRNAQIVMVPGVAGAFAFYEVDGEKIPYEFVQAWFWRCSDTHLQPIRDYSEGSQGRKWSTILTKFFVNRGIARPAVGSDPAAWTVDKQQAQAWFALVEEE